MKIKINDKENTITLSIEDKSEIFYIKDGISDDYGSLLKSLSSRLHELENKKLRNQIKNYEEIIKFSRSKKPIDKPQT